MNNRLVFYTLGLYPCLTGGMEIYNYQLISTLRDTNKTYRLQILTTCRKQVSTHKDSYFINTRFFGLRRYFFGAISSFFSLLFNREIHWSRRMIIFIPLTSNFSYHGLIFILLHALFKMPYVLHIHSGGRRDSLKPFWIYKLLFKKAWKVAGVSQNIVDEYSKMFFRRVYLLLPLLPLKLVEETPTLLKKKHNLVCFDKLILFVGSMKNAKGPLTLLNAFLKLKKEIIIKYNIGLIFCGDGPLKNELLEISNNNHLSERIIFKGNVPYEQINEYYAISDVFVLPSWYEGTPISLLQALQNSLVCIVSNVEGNNTIIQHGFNGLLFPKDDSNSLMEIISSVFEGGQDICELKNKAKLTFDTRYKYDDYIEKFLIYLSKEYQTI